MGAAAGSEMTDDPAEENKSDANDDQTNSEHGLYLLILVSMQASVECSLKQLLPPGRLVHVRASGGSISPVTLLVNTPFVHSTRWQHATNGCALRERGGFPCT